MSETNESTALVKSYEDLPPAIIKAMEDDEPAAKKEMFNGINARPIRIKVENGYYFLGLDDPVRSFEGSILALGKLFGYWHNPKGPYNVGELPADFDETEKPPPICGSLDGVNGSHPLINIQVNGEYGVENVPCFGRGGCAKCYFNRFKTVVQDDGRREGGGKACNQNRQVLILPVGAIVPHILKVSATSLTEFDDYITFIANKGKLPYKVWTNFGCEIQKSGKMEWTTLKLSQASDVTPDELQTIHPMRMVFKHLVEAEVIAEGDNGNGDDGEAESPI